jgi:hypothetical protein
MAVLNPIEKDELLRALDELPPEAIAEVRAFIAFQKYKTQASTQVGAVAVGGWLKGFRFGSGDIDQARTEMWGRLQDSRA